MKLGLFQMPFHLPHRGLYESWERDLELLVLADRLGYKEAWIGEHTTLPWENIPVPELIIAQALRMTDNIAFELIAAITPHDVRAVGTAAGDVDLGDVTLLPPTLTLQYHVPFDNGFKPYVGVGINYTAFFDEDVPSAGVVTDTHFDDSVGPALQVGMDYFLTDDWFVNLDFKYLFIDTDVSINGGDITASVDINPIVFGFGVGYRF